MVPVDIVRTSEGILRGDLLANRGGDHEVFECQADGFENGYVIITPANRTRKRLGQVGDDVGSVENSFADWHAKLAGLPQRGFTRFNDDARAANGFGIELALRGAMGPDRVDVNAVREQAAREERSDSSSTSTDDVCTGNVLKRSRRRVEPKSLGIRCQARSVRGRSRDNADLLDAADAQHESQVLACLDAGAEDHETT